MDVEPPGLNEVILFRVSLIEDGDTPQQLVATLSAEERRHAERLLLPALRLRFIIGRSRLRQILGAMCGCPAESVQIRYEKWGKPYMLSAALPKLAFNVSHSGDQALIAVAGSPLGVDIEVLSAESERRVNYRALVPQVVSRLETSSWNAIPAREHEVQFMRLWVCKEALLKAMGVGIADGLQQISFAIPMHAEDCFSPSHIDPNMQIHFDDDGSCRTNHWTDASAWKVHMLDVGPNAFAALACSRAIETIKNHVIA